MIDYNQERILTLGNLARRWCPLHNRQNIEESLRGLGVQVRYFGDERYQSSLEWDEVNDHPIIALNVHLSKADRNFAILHELGHLLVEYHWLPYSHHQVFDKYLLNIEYSQHGCVAFTDKNGRNWLNGFAAAYLIPTEAIQHIIRDHDLDYIELINGIAKMFSVPLRMARARLDTFLAVE